MFVAFENTKPFQEFDLGFNLWYKYNAKLDWYILISKLIELNIFL